MRSHTKGLLLSLDFIFPHHSHSHHLTALYLHDCRVLCHVLTITALIPSHTGNLKEKREQPLLESQYVEQKLKTHIHALEKNYLLWVSQNAFGFPSRTQILLKPCSKREEDRWTCCLWRGCQSYLLQFSSNFNILKQIYMHGLKEHPSWPSLVGLNSTSVTWSMFSLASQRLWRSHGPLSSLVNFTPSAFTMRLPYEYTHSYTYSEAMQRDFQKCSLLRRNLKRPERTKWRKALDGGLAGCFHSCHGDELASYD